MKNRKTLIQIAIVIMFAFPLIYLVQKRWDAAPLKEEQPVVVPGDNIDLASLEALVKKDPNFDNLINLSMAYVNRQMPGKSIDLLKRAAQMNPGSAVVYNNLGVAYTMLQQYQNVVEACVKALQIDSSFQLAKNNLKWAMDEKSKVVNAIASEEKMPAEKRDLGFYTDLGLNYFKVGDYGKSIEIWNKIFEIDPKSVTALNNIGTAFMMKGQIDDAVVLFKKALELEPSNQLAKNNLAWAIDEKAKSIK